MNDAGARSPGSAPPETPGGQAQGAPADEHLATTRLPPVSAPPVGRSGRPQGPLPSSTPLAPTVEREPPSHPRDVSSAAPVLSRHEKAEREERLVRLSMGGMAAGLGLALALSGLVVGLVVGLRGVSTDAAAPAAVAVALVMTRGFIVLGMIAFGCGLILFATRLLLAREVVPGR